MAGWHAEKRWSKRGRKRGNENGQEGWVDWEERRSQRHKKEMNIPQSEETRDEIHGDIIRRQRLEDKRQLKPFSGLLSHPGSTMRGEMMSACDHCLLRKLADTS